MSRFFLFLLHLVIKEETLSSSSSFFSSPCWSCRSAAKQKGSWVTAVLEDLLPPAGSTMWLISASPLRWPQPSSSKTRFPSFWFSQQNKHFKNVFFSFRHNSFIVYLNSSEFNMNSSLSVQRKTCRKRVSVSFKTLIFISNCFIIYIKR